MFSNLSKYMTRLINWSNARAQLLNSIITQKMGLYNHYLFGDISSSVVSKSGPLNFPKLITQKAPNKNCSRRHINFLLLSFEENKA